MNRRGMVKDRSTTKANTTRGMKDSRRKKQSSHTTFQLTTDLPTFVVQGMLFRQTLTRKLVPEKQLIEKIRGTCFTWMISTKKQKRKNTSSSKSESMTTGKTTNRQ